MPSRRRRPGAFLGGGPIARARLEDNHHTHPLGCAFVCAAADWRRVGLSTIAQPELTDLAPHYLPDSYRHDPGETPAQAIDWATERIDQAVQLLQSTGPDTFTCSDYILDYLTQAAGPVPTSTWQTAVDTQNADPGELLSVGINAHKEDQLAIAITAFRRTARSNSHDDAPPRRHQPRHPRKRALRPVRGTPADPVGLPLCLDCLTDCAAMAQIRLSLRVRPAR